MNASLWRGRVRSILKRYGLLPAAVTLRRIIRLLLSPRALWQGWGRWREYWEVKQRYGPVLRPSPYGRLDRRALIFGMGMLDYIKVELALLKSLQLAGYRTVVLLGWRHPLHARYYELAGAEKVLQWNEFAPTVDGRTVNAAMAGIRSTGQLLEFEHEGARAGRFAAAGSLRSLRIGNLDLESGEVRPFVAQRLLDAMNSAAAAGELIHWVKPHLAIFVDRGYTPQGELFDRCLAAGVDTVTYNAAHKNNCLIFKRYTPQTRDTHPSSLSFDSWDRLRRIEWTDSHRQRLRDEIYTNYAKGEWYNEVGTQFHKRIVPQSELIRRLRLDPAKKTAVIFSHIFWDATFFWGRDLFANYEEWFVGTVRAACANSSVNWIVKVHPANVTKNRRDGVTGEPSEMTAVRQYIGELPPHIALIPADSDINTYSLFDMMDYCLTVRGTIGIEAASFGISVLTAGTGRYDHLGFTCDSETREEYLAKLARIADIPPLSPAQRELAERFAYGVFLLRPLPLESVTLEYQQDSRASICSRFRVETPEEWARALDLRALADWFRSDREDFLTLDGLS